MTDPVPDDIRDPAKVPFSLGGAPDTGRLLRSIAPPQPQKPPQEGPPGVSVEEYKQRLMEARLRATEDLMKANVEEAERRKRFQAASISRGFALDEAHRRAANEPLPPTYEPKYEPTAAPPRFSPRDPSNAMAQPLSLLAAIGGLFARRAGTATIKAMTAAMEGLKENDKQKYEMALKEYDENLKRTIEYNKLEHQKYNEAWTNRKETMNERLARLQLLSTQYGNKALAQALQTGNAELIQAQISAMDGALKTISNMEKKTGAGHAMDAVQAQAVEELYEKKRAVDPDYTRAEAVREVTGRQSAAERRAGKEFDWDKRIELQQARIDAAERRGDKTDDLKRELERMKEDANKEIHKEQHEYRMEEIARRLQATGQLGGVRKLDPDVFHRFQILKQEQAALPDEKKIDDERLMVEAYRQHQDFLGKTSWSKVPLSIQQDIKVGWGDDSEAMKAWRDGAYKTDAPPLRRMANAAHTLRTAEDVANFVKLHPRAMGITAQIMNTMGIEQLVPSRSSINKFEPNSPEDLREAALQTQAIEARLEGNLSKMVGQRMPNGQTITLSDANDAITLMKKLVTLSLSDAAALSTNGQGGTVYLDKQMRDVYRQITSPEAMFRLIGIRQEEANQVWRDSSPATPLDWHERRDIKQTMPFFAGNAHDARGDFIINGDYLADAQFNKYSDRRGPQLQRDTAGDQSLNSAVRLALQERDKFARPEDVGQWVQQARSANLTPQQLVDVENAAKILLRNLFGMH